MTVKKMRWGFLREKNEGPCQWTKGAGNARISLPLGQKRGEDAVSLVGDALGVGVETDDGCLGVDALGGRGVWLPSVGSIESREGAERSEMVKKPTTAPFLFRS
jgi:hypothetical protein